MKRKTQFLERQQFTPVCRQWVSEIAFFFPSNLFIWISTFLAVYPELSISLFIYMSTAIIYLSTFLSIQPKPTIQLSWLSHPQCIEIKMVNNNKITHSVMFICIFITFFLLHFFWGNSGQFHSRYCPGF